jgi:hypothetical protein
MHVYGETTHRLPLAKMFAKVDCSTARYQQLLLEFLAEYAS